MVITDVNQVVYLGNGSRTAFPFTFRIIDATDVKLLLIDADGTETDITSDYFVDTNTNTVYYPGYAPGAESGLADQPAPVQTGQRLVVYRELPVTQEKDLGDKWPFNVIELALDKVTMILQQVYEWWGRTLRISEGDAATHPDFDMTFPIEPGKSFRVNMEGTGFEASADPGPYAEIAMEAATTAAAAAEAAAAAAAGVELQAQWYDSVADMRSANIPAGITAGTKGYYSVNDGGSAVYTIRAQTQEDVDDGGSIIFLNNGNVAELICDSVSYACFGAVSDGESNAPTNNYERIKACHLYANKTKKPVVNYGGKYYITGRPAIPVESDVYNYGDTTYYIGTQNLKSDALFQWSHDSETSVQGVALSTVMSDAIVVTSSYENKAFLIKTSVSLGTNQDTGGVDYIMEPMLATYNRANLYMDVYNNVKDWIVDIEHITDATEKGYTWDGGILRNYDTSTYGTCFLSARRNNCIIRNLTIACDSNKAEHSTIHAETANNLLIENIVVESESVEDTWGYWLSSYYLTNVTVRNVRQSANQGKTNGWAQRTVKNAYCLNNTIKAYDCHWNAYGVHLVENCTLSSHAHMGYGKGKFIVRNSAVNYHVGGRMDFVPIYAGDIIVEDCVLGIYGIWLRTAPAIDSTRDMTYFAKIPVPRIYAKRNITKQLITSRAITNYLPLEITDILEDKIKIVLEEYKKREVFHTGDDTPKCKHFQIILKEYKYTYFSDLSSFYNNIDVPQAHFRVIDSKLQLVSEITFNSSVQITSADPTKYIRNKNGTKFLYINFVGDINVEAWGTIGSIFDIISPPTEVPFLLAVGENIYPCYINREGNITSIRAINSSASRITASASW